MKAADYILKVGNDEEGRFFLHCMKRYLNPCYMVEVRGSTPDRKKAKRDKIPLRRFQRRIPIEYSKNLRIYIHERNGNGRGRTVGLSLFKEIKEYMDLWRETDSKAKEFNREYWSLVQRVKAFAASLPQGDNIEWERRSGWITVEGGGIERIGSC